MTDISISELCFKRLTIEQAADVISMDSKTRQEIAIDNKTRFHITQDANGSELGMLELDTHGESSFIAISIVREGKH